MILKRALKLIKLNLKPTKKTDKLNSSLTHSTRTISEENHIPFEENTIANDHPFGCNISDLVHLPGEVSRFLVHVSDSETTENHSDFFAFFPLFSLSFFPPKKLLKSHLQSRIPQLSNTSRGKQRSVL